METTWFSEAPAAAEKVLTPSRSSQLELFDLFNRFLIRWANEAAQWAGMDTEDVSYLPLEQSILFKEPFTGLIVLRSTQGLEEYLASEFARKKNAKPPHSKGLFLEMTVLFWHELILKMWKVDARKLSPALFKASAPVHWPDRKADAFCTVFIKDFPLEIRLWTDVTADEMEPWKRSKI